MDRRDFLKKAVQMGGVAALYNLGVTLEQARAWGVLPAVVGGETGFPGDSWSAWDEGSEDTLAADQDGDGVEDTFIAFFENTVAGGDETGRGVLSGADLVLTQAGNIAGATGAPPFRALDGTDDHFAVTQTFIDTLIGNAGKAWTIFLAIENIDNLTDGNNKYVIEWSSAGSVELVQPYIDGTGKLSMNIREGGGGIQGATTTDAMTHPTKYYIMVWADGGTNKVRAGFSTTKPTKWSDFAANDRIEVATYMGDFSGEAFTARKNIFTANPATASHHVDCDALYFGASTTCFIDNSA